MISVRNLKKSFGSNHVLKGINLDIEDGEILVVVGSSGSGKSTFLRCLNLLEMPTSGDILIDGNSILNKYINIDKIRQKNAMVFQQFNLFSNLTAIENIKLALKKLLKKTDKEATRVAKKYLKSVGLEDRANHYPHQLSGGQKQRVAIARALAVDPDVILFDEPTSALDPEMIDEVLNVIKEVAKLGKTMVIVTHEMNFARDIGTRMIFLDKGNIIEDGIPKEVMCHPKTERARNFFS